MNEEAWDELRRIAQSLGDVDASDPEEVGDEIDRVTTDLRRIADELEELDRIRNAEPLVTPEEER